MKGPRVTAIHVDTGWELAIQTAMNLDISCACQEWRDTLTPVRIIPCSQVAHGRMSGRPVCGEGLMAMVTSPSEGIENRLEFSTDFVTTWPHCLRVKSPSANIKDQTNPFLDTRTSPFNCYKLHRALITPALWSPRFVIILSLLRD